MARLWFSRNPVIVPSRLKMKLIEAGLSLFLDKLGDRLVIFLMDRHERLVPDIMEWQLTQCDINKDSQSQ